MHNYHFSLLVIYILHHNLHINQNIRHRKYEKIRRTTSPSLVLKRKYPANQYAGQDSEEEDAGFSKKYTTASTFRNKNTTQTPAASKELQSEQKYFSADSIEIKVPSFSSGVKPQSYKDQILTQGRVSVCLVKSSWSFWSRSGLPFVCLISA